MVKRKILFVMLLLCSSFYVSAQVEAVQEKQAGISRRLQQEIEDTKDPMLGYVPKSRLYQAYTERKQRLQEMAALQRAPLFTWTERGPYSDVVGPSNGNTRPGNGKTAGRCRTIWEDLRNTNTVWVGGIDGGLWRTNDINASPANWVPINDYFGNLAVSSITQDPSDFNIMYFGTGEKSINIDAVRGGGVWRSTDGGVNWSVMPGTETFYNIGKILCDAAGNLYVANNSTSGTIGLRRYTKATGIWSAITPSGLATRCTDIEISSTGRLHATFGYYNTATASAGYRYTDNPATVTSASGWTTPATTFPTQYNAELAVNGNTVYAVSSSSAWQGTLYKSTNGGANWATTTAQPASGWASGQAWYSLSLGIDPNNANNVIVGGLDCYKTTTGGTSWTKISNWIGTTGQYIHADQHTLVWNASNRVLFGGDGGVFYSANGGTTITDRNVGLNIKQFYSLAVHPTAGSNYFLAGAQDNGTHQLNQPGLSTSVEVTGGDGAWTAIDQNQPQYQIGAYVFNQYRKSTDGGATWSSANFSATAGKFINPFIYDNTANILYACGAANAYVRWSNPQTGSTFSSVSLTALSGGQATAFCVSPYSSNVVYMGGSGTTTTILRVTSANGTPAATNITGTGMSVSGQNVSSIQLGTSEQNIIVAMSNYGVNNIWVTNNGGTTWTAIDGNLPDMPVRWAMFYPGDNTKAIIATETGVWQTELINGTSTVWDPETGFPNVRTDMLQYRASDGLLAAATHGRGIFSTFIGAAPATCNAPTGLASSAITTTGATVSWAAVSGAVSYDVDYKLSTATTWTNAVTATTATSRNITGLTASTLYDYRVRTNCASASSAYTQAQFTTNTATATCNAPTGLASSAITTTGATVSWAAVSDAVSYDVDYKLNTATTWTNAVTATTATSRNITGLTASTLYNYRVRTNCASASSAYTQANFTTSTPTATCPGPLDVSTNGTATGAATIPFNTDAKGTISSSTDNDYYKFVITTGGTATITLSTLPADFDMRLYSSNGTTQLAISQNGGTTSETITRTYTAGTYYVRAYGYNGANSTTCYTLRVQLGTATMQQPIELVSNKGLEIMTFPNPTKDKLNVSIIGDNSARTLSLYNLQGQQVYSQQVSNVITTLDIHKLVKGVYIVKVADDNGKTVYSEKVVKD